MARPFNVLLFLSYRLLTPLRRKTARSHYLLSHRDFVGLSVPIDSLRQAQSSGQPMPQEDRHAAFQRGRRASFHALSQPDTSR